MTDLVEFLRAVLDDDERVARAAGGGTWEQGTMSHDTNVVRPRGDFDWVGVAGERLDVPVLTGQTSNTSRGLWEGRAAHIARHDPARVLAEVAAKQAILEIHPGSTERDECPGCGAWLSGTWATPPGAMCPVVAALAQPYAGRPGWREEWRI